MVTPQENYKRAPLTEAVIELRFDASMSPRDMDRLSERFKAFYQSVEEMRSVEVQFDTVSGTVKQKQVKSGYKMTAQNAVDVFVIRTNSVATTRYAPYQNWESLLAQAQENFDKALKVLDRPKISRIGARFVNRIDVPNNEIKDGLGEFFPSINGFAIGVIEPTWNYHFILDTKERSTGAKVRIETGTVIPKLIDRTSVSIDIDAFWDSDIPLKFDEMWIKASLLREAKNSVFEASITDKTRALFR